MSVSVRLKTIKATAIATSCNGVVKICVRVTVRNFEISHNGSFLSLRSIFNIEGIKNRRPQIFKLWHQFKEFRILNKTIIIRINQSINQSIDRSIGRGTCFYIIKPTASRQEGPFQNQNMNCKEHYLPELELATGQVREALQAILYTILL